MLSCADCKCVEDICKNLSPKNCTLCTKRICCCQGIHKRNNRYSILLFLHHARPLFAAALGIEILCISAAMIGENSAFYFFGYDLKGIIAGYVWGYLGAGEHRNFS